MKSKFGDLLNSNRAVLVAFYAGWSDPCKNLGYILQQVKSEIRDEVKIIKINVDKNHLLAANYRISDVPTILFFKNGEQVWRQSGVQQKNQLIKMFGTE